MGRREVWIVGMVGAELWQGDVRVVVEGRVLGYGDVRWSREGEGKLRLLGSR